MRSHRPWLRVAGLPAASLSRIGGRYGSVGLLSSYLIHSSWSLLRSSRFESGCRVNKRVSWHFCHCRLLGPCSPECRTELTELQVASCLPTTTGQVQLSGQTHQWCLVIFQSKYLEENASLANSYSTSNIALLLRQNGFFHVPRDST